MMVKIDLDMVAHELGHLRKEDGDLFDVSEVAPIAKGRVLSIVMGSQAGGWEGFLTRGKHFRDVAATILKYKGNRDGAPRDNVDALKDMFHEDLGAVWCDDREADDAMATEQWGDLASVGMKYGWEEDILKKHAGTVIATRDKDLWTVPGWHFRWWLKGGKDSEGVLVTEERRTVEKGEASWVTVVEAFRNFYKMALMGDASDNIKGIYGVGKKSAWIKQLDDIDDEYKMYMHVEEKYIKHFGNYGKRFLLETCRLLHMQRWVKDKWLPPHERPAAYWFI